MLLIILLCRDRKVPRGLRHPFCGTEDCRRVCPQARGVLSEQHRHHADTSGVHEAGRYAQYRVFLFRKGVWKGEPHLHVETMKKKVCSNPYGWTKSM